MGPYSDDESQSCKKPRPSEANASSEMNLPVHSSNVGMRFDAQEPCYLFSKGRCTYGERCRYVHVIGNVKEIEGERGQWAVNQRRTEKVNFCQFFVGGRPCTYGNKCRFLHETGGNNNDGSGMGRESSAICIVTDNDGGKSKNLASRSSNDPQVPQNVTWLKTKLCTQWEKFGSCPYGSNCNFAHGNAELRKFDHPNPLDSSRGSDLGTSSLRRESGVVHQQQEQGKKFFFKWTDVKKISQVYADWIDDDASDKAGN